MACKTHTMSKNLLVYVNGYHCIYNSVHVKTKTVKYMTKLCNYQRFIFLYAHELTALLINKIE